ncbi:MAG: hypothetical protein U9N56_00500 [Actinomycetota bacterium]|nr:hypothetical protein [Actinomycetota bacterium]
MTQLADTTAPAREMRNLRILIGLAIASTLVAVLAGLVVLVASPEAGSTPEAILGITAAASGLATAGIVIAAFIYAQVKNLWQYAPPWIRIAFWVVAAYAIATTLWNWITQIT